MRKILRFVFRLSSGWARGRGVSFTAIYVMIFNFIFHKKKTRPKEEKCPGIDKHASQLSTSSDAPPTPPLGNENWHSVCSTAAIF